MRAVTRTTPPNTHPSHELSRKIARMGIDNAASGINIHTLSLRKKRSGSLMAEMLAVLISILASVLRWVGRHG